MAKHGIECYRLGTLSLNAVLDEKTGQVLGKTTRCHIKDMLSDPPVLDTSGLKGFDNLKLDWTPESRE